MKNQNKGFTLVEIMVAIVIGVISIAAAFSAYGYFNKTYNSVSQKADINNSAREALSVISRDLKNVGYVDINYTKVAKSEIKLIWCLCLMGNCVNKTSITCCYTFDVII